MSKKMAIVQIKIEYLEKILQIPDGTAIVDARRPFGSSDCVEFKIEGAGWETMDGGIIPHCSAPKMTIKNECGALDIDWGDSF